ncbi:MAG: PQQ-like domain [Blastocatellia bacterium]|jgi:outer membrane protein assembly factor BamB|nr:PQQ-like domain [Blastocatellia bacterium]
MPQSLFSSPKLFLLALLALALAVPSLAQKQTTSPQQKSELRLSWEGTPGVNRYRLQVSRDAKFDDLVFDRAVEGREYVVTDLPLGHYYWRVAPAAAETGAFSRPRPIELPGNTKVESATVIAPQTQGSPQPSKTGWSAATGSVAQPIVVKLRDAAAPDVVGVNSDGMVYALDATNGEAIWTARFRPDAKRGEPTGNGGALPFQPVALGAVGSLENILVAHEGGVRAIEGSTGRQLWRAALPGRAASGVAADMDGDGALEIAVFQDNPAGLTLLDANTGRVIAQDKLEGSMIGSPAILSSQAESGVLFALASGTLDLHNMKGERVRSTKLDVQFTTPPLILQRPGGALAMIGTDHGLVAVEVATLKPLWRVATEGDAPRGQLAAADLDNDGSPEVVMITRRSRTVVVSTANGKIKWYANIPNRAATAILTDLNGDGAADVLVASDSSHLFGHDGRNGALIFGDDKGNGAGAANAEGENAAYQTCAYLKARGGAGATPLVVCNDPAGGGLRADSLPSSIKR